MVGPHRLRGFLREAAIWTLVATVALGVEIQLAKPARAAVSGQTTLYFHKEPSDANETFNALLPLPAEPGADTPVTTTTSTTNVNASPATALCESSGNTGETFNQVSASAATTGERCIGSFISPPVGQAISVATSDTNALSIDLYTSESSSQATSTPKAYIYKWNGTTLTNFATFTGADPGTAITHFNAAATPSANVTFTSTDRVVVILSQSVTKSHTSTTVSNYFDNNSRSPSANFTMNYSLTTPNTPSLTGTNDDDFTQAQATTACTSSPSFHTVWTCLDPVNANANVSFNDEDPAPTGSAGDTSHWLWLRDECGSGATACTSPSNFGTTPSNAFLYQSLPIGYGDGNVRTVLESSLAYTVAGTSPSTPFSHSGIVLWTSNTDYLEVQIYAGAVKGAINTAKVAINNSGTLSTTANINSGLSNGFYNRMWVGFAKTGTGYQPQYSTDGSTWTSLGSAITHATAFTRVGLNSYSGVSIASTVTNYAAAFNWFSYGFAAPPGPTVTQRMRDGKWWNSGAQQNYWLN
jgi:hypothetical protein